LTVLCVLVVMKFLKLSVVKLPSKAIFIPFYQKEPEYKNAKMIGQHQTNL